MSSGWGSFPRQLCIGVTSPLVLDHVPDFLYWIKLATMWRQEHLREPLVEELPHRHRLVHAEVVHHHYAVPAFTLFSQFDEELDEGVSVVALCKSVGVEEASLRAYSSNHRYRPASGAGQLHAHSGLQPHPRWRLPEVEGRLVDVHDLYIFAVNGVPKDLAREIFLLLPDLLLPLDLRPVHRLGLDVLGSQLFVASVHS